MIFSDTNSVFIDSGSTFTQNAARSGGAIYFVKTNISSTDTNFTENYAYDAG